MNIMIWPWEGLKRLIFFLKLMIELLKYKGQAKWVRPFGGFFVIAVIVGLFLSGFIGVVKYSGDMAQTSRLVTVIVVWVITGLVWSACVKGSHWNNPSFGVLDMFMAFCFGVIVAHISIVLLNYLISMPKDMPYLT
jgi:hypothetical protein